MPGNCLEYKKTMEKKIPKSLRPILWSANSRNLDQERDKNYIVHQVLLYGDFSNIKWLFKIYSLENVRQVFLFSPKKIYPKPIFRFIKNFILDLKKVNLDEEKYIRTSL